MCQLNSSHICPYFLHLLDTFTEKIKKKKQKEQCLQKKSLQKHTAVHHLLPQAGYLITSEKNQRRFQGAPLECTNYILFLKKMGKKWWALRRCKHISRGHLLQEFFKFFFKFCGLLSKPKLYQGAQNPKIFILNNCCIDDNYLFEKRL